MTESGNPSQPANVNEYNASHIQVLEGREAIRRRPGMYIGSSGERGLHQMVYEVVSYAVDEHLAGHADAIDVTITAELELTELSFGSKPRTVYWLPGGLGGLGLPVVNALSSRLRVEVHRDGRRWTQEYQKGIPITALTRNEESDGHGTAIVFVPDGDIFETTLYSFATLSQRLQKLAFLNGGLAISLTDERPERPRTRRVSSTPPPSPSSQGPRRVRRIRRIRTRRSSCRSPCSGTPGPRAGSTPSRTAAVPMRAALTSRASVPHSRTSSTTTPAASGRSPQTTKTSPPKPSARG